MAQITSDCLFKLRPTYKMAQITSDCGATQAGRPGKTMEQVRHFHPTQGPHCSDGEGEDSVCVCGAQARTLPLCLLLPPPSVAHAPTRPQATSKLSGMYASVYLVRGDRPRPSQLKRWPCG